MGLESQVPGSPEMEPGSVGLSADSATDDTMRLSLTCRVEGVPGSTGTGARIVGQVPPLVVHSVWLPETT